MRDIKRTYMNFSSRYKILAILVPILALLTLGAAQIYPNLVLKGKPWHSIRAYTTAARAVTAIGTTKSVLLLDGNITISDNLTIPSNVTLQNFGDSSITISGSAVLRINGPFESPTIQVFKGTKNVRFGSGSVKQVDVKWFGPFNNGIDSDTSAVQAAFDSLPGDATIMGNGGGGGELYLGPGKWRFNLKVTKHFITMRGPGFSFNNGLVGTSAPSDNEWLPYDLTQPLIQVGDDAYFAIRDFRLKDTLLKGAVWDERNVANKVGQQGLWIKSAWSASISHVGIADFKDYQLKIYSDDSSMYADGWELKEITYNTTMDHVWIQANNFFPSDGIRNYTPISTGGANEGLSIQEAYINGSDCSNVTCIYPWGNYTGGDCSVASAHYNTDCTDGSHWNIRGAGGVVIYRTWLENWNRHGLLFNNPALLKLTATASIIETTGTQSWPDPNGYGYVNTQVDGPPSYSFNLNNSGLTGCYKDKSGNRYLDWQNTGDAEKSTLMNIGGTNEFIDTDLRYMTYISGLTDNDTRKTEWILRKDGNDLQFFHAYQSTRIGKIKYTPWNILTGSIEGWLAGGLTLFEIEPNFRSNTFLTNYNLGYTIDNLSYFRPKNPDNCMGNCTITNTSLFSFPVNSPVIVGVDVTDSGASGAIKIFHEEMWKPYYIPYFSGATGATWGSKMVYEITDNMTIGMGGADIRWPAYISDLTTPKKRLGHAIYHKLADLYACGGNCTIDEGDVFWFADNPLGTHKATTNVDKTQNVVLGTFKVLLSDNSTGHVPIYSDTEVVNVSSSYSSDNGTMECGKLYVGSTDHYVFHLPTWQINCPIKIRPYNGMTGRIWVVPATGERLELPAKTAYGTANQMLKSGGTPTDLLTIEAGLYEGYWDIWIINGNWTIQGP